MHVRKSRRSCGHCTWTLLIVEKPHQPVGIDFFLLSVCGTKVVHTKQ